MQPARGICYDNRVRPSVYLSVTLVICVKTVKMSRDFKKIIFLIYYYYTTHCSCFSHIKFRVDYPRQCDKYKWV